MSNPPSTAEQAPQTLTLTEFLLARIAEDEADAEDALDRGFGGWEYFADQGVNHESRTHIVRHHPARVLAEVEAKRRIVEAYGIAATDSVDYELGFGLDFAIRTLAAIHADHPDFREEWRA